MADTDPACTTVLDLPWRKFTVRLRIWARRFFCDEPICPRKIFADRFTGLLPRYGRRTEEATGLLLGFAHAPAVKLEPDSRELRVCQPVKTASGTCSRPPERLTVEDQTG